MGKLEKAFCAEMIVTGVLLTMYVGYLLFSHI